MNQLPLAREKKALSLITYWFFFSSHNLVIVPLSQKCDFYASLSLVHDCDNTDPVKPVSKVLIHMQGNEANENFLSVC